MAHHYGAMREAVTPKPITRRRRRIVKRVSALPVSPRETDIVRTILDGLHACGIMAWRVNTGAMAGSHNGKSRFVRFGPKGQADIQGVWHGGRFLAIEVKRPSGKVTLEQADWLARIRDVGGIAIVAHSWAEVEQRLWGQAK